MCQEQFVKMRQVWKTAIGGNFAQGIRRASQLARGVIHAHCVDVIGRRNPHKAAHGARHVRVRATCRGDKTGGTLAKYIRVLCAGAGRNKPIGRVLAHALGWTIKRHEEGEQERFEVEFATRAAFKLQRRLIKRSELAHISVGDGRRL